MLTWRNDSDTLIVVLHEIYGINDHIAEACRGLSGAGYDVVCPDLLDGRPAFSYAQEEEAYKYFTNYVGFDSSLKQVAFLLRQEELEYRRIFLLGFSAGATIAWLCSGNIANLNGVICFYGSRIRDRLDIEPKCPTLLILAEEEKAFDSHVLQEKLDKKELTEVHLLKGKHGFADPYSENYNETSAREANRLTMEFIKRQEKIREIYDKKR